VFLANVVAITRVQSEMTRGGRASGYRVLSRSAGSFLAGRG